MPANHGHRNPLNESHITCTSCHEIKPNDGYHFYVYNYEYRSGHRIARQCKECIKKWRRDRHYEVKYGITKQEYQVMLTNQHNQCAICCQTSDKLFVDHDHADETIRGLLCRECNLALGMLKDDPAVCMRAAQYLIGSK